MKLSKSTKHDVALLKMAGLLLGYFALAWIPTQVFVYISTLCPDCYIDDYIRFDHFFQFLVAVVLPWQRLILHEVRSSRSLSTLVASFVHIKVKPNPLKRLRWLGRRRTGPSSFNLRSFVTLIVCLVPFLSQSNGEAAHSVQQRCECLHLRWKTPRLQGDLLPRLQITLPLLLLPQVQQDQPDRRH